ncbi:MAG: hypothetical protein MUQ30_03775, partial [Anaerolineae bacterium]|nr:hypothetical protein [Anaerolineae bacterium]
MPQDARTPMQTVSLSLSDLVGSAYTDAVCRARAFLTGTPLEELRAIAGKSVDLAPPWYQN